MAPPIAMLFSAADDNTYNWFIMHNSFHPRTPCKFWIRFWEGFPSWQEGIAHGMFLWSQGYAEGGGRAIATHVLLPGHQLKSLHTPCCSYCFSKPWFPATSATPYCADGRDPSDSPFQCCLSHHGQMASLLCWQLLSRHHTIWPLLCSQFIAVYVYKPKHCFP